MYNVLTMIVFSWSAMVVVAESPVVAIDDFPGLQHVITIIDGDGQYEVINGSLPYGDEGLTFVEFYK